jgi:hypothetical protein
MRPFKNGRIQRFDVGGFEGGPIKSFAILVPDVVDRNAATDTGGLALSLRVCRIE